MRSLQGQRVLVMGLGGFGGGAGAARFCVEQGAQVAVTDQRSEAQLAASLRELDGLPIRYTLGRHEERDFTDCDLIVVNPAVDRRVNPYLDAARAAGVALTSEIELLIERMDRRRVIGVTGTAGKSTTVAMIGHLLSHARGAGRVHIGGNLGGSLLGRLSEIGHEDWVVLELSSFMLEPITGWSPHIAVFTNLSDNHLDRHGTFESYAAAKSHILAYQRPGDHAVLGPGLPHGIQPVVGHTRILRTPEDGFPRLSIPGEHNRLNALIALKACECAGVTFGDAAEAQRVLASFAGLPHRLQWVGERAGVRFFNDSKSTTPESAILAIDAFEPGTVRIILGGYDKHADLSALARHAAQRCAGVYTIGQTGDALADAVASQPGASATVERCGELDRAVHAAARDASAGQVVLLSPACASWGRFANFEERGRLFAEIVLRYIGSR